MTPSTLQSGWPPVSPSGRITYRPATPEDAAELAPKLRKSDIAEMALTWTGSPEARLAESVRLSAESWALLIDGQTEAVFGLVRYLTARPVTQQRTQLIATSRRRAKNTALRVVRALPLAPWRARWGILLTLSNRWDLPIDRMGSTRYPCSLMAIRFTGWRT